MGQTPNSIRDSSHDSRQNRLDSWKAIAAYLERDVSTVRRWEKHEGLPVHRHLHRKLGSVYAFPSEIDEWWRNGHRGDAALALNEGAAGPSPLHEARTVRRFHAPLRLAVGALVFAAAWFDLSGPRSRPPSSAASTFVAVMPFAIVPGKSSDEELADNLTDGVIHGLSGLPGLKVISRHSAFRYKGREIVPRRVGRELGGVGTLLVGRVRQDSDRIVLTAELIDTRDESLLWSRTYDRRPSATGESLYESIVSDVARALTGRDHTSVYGRRARSGEAYELYLRGRHHWYKRTPEGFERALAAFSRAIEKDPGFAPAYAGLADTYTVMGYFAYLIPFEEARSKARAAAQRALALDDSLAEAHTSMASVLEFEQWDWVAAEREYQRAIELAPSYATAHHWYANNLSYRGRHEEAIAQGRRAVELDPLSPILHVALAHAYLLAGRYDEASSQLATALDIEPSSANAHLFQGMAFMRQARYEEALDEMTTADGLFESWVWKAFLADLYMRMDRAEDAFGIVRSFERRRPVASRVTRAAIYAAVGERERPLALLRRACEERDPDIGFVQSMPAFDRLRSDPEFQALLRRTGLS